MALTRKPSPEELALLEILEDPVWLGEFLRSTQDFALNEEERSRQQRFEYRWYQKDLLTDESENIVLRGGRAIGKCNTVFNKVYTYPFGYISIQQLINTGMPYFTAITLAPDGSWQQRRAFVQKDKSVPFMRVLSYSGYKTDVTLNHPILTPDGWVEAKELREGSLIAVPSRLPADQVQNNFHWTELRWLGYVFGQDRRTFENDVGPEMPFDLRFQSQVNEFSRIADYFDANLRKNRDGSYQIRRKRRQNVRAPHHGTRLLEMFSAKQMNMDWAGIPWVIKAERLENIKVFLESLLSMAGDFSEPGKVVFRAQNKRLVRDVQEFLLRCGVETLWRQEQGRYSRIETRDYNAYYTLFTELSIPGVVVKNIRPPSPNEVNDKNYRFEEIVSIEEQKKRQTYAVQVMDHANYISDGIIVHNSVVLEDKMVYNVINAVEEFPQTREFLLTTSNTSQMTPILDHFTNRFLVSPLLKGFLNGQINKSKGTMDFSLNGGSNLRMFSRIAGQSAESNVVGLHLPRVYADEIQLYPIGSWTQLMPAVNRWENRVQVFVCGVK